MTKKDKHGRRTSSTVIFLTGPVASRIDAFLDNPETGVHRQRPGSYRPKHAKPEKEPQVDSAITALQELIAKLEAVVQTMLEAVVQTMEAEGEADIAIIQKGFSAACAKLIEELQNLM